MTRRTLAIAAIALAGALGLSACQSQTPTPTDTPEPTTSETTTPTPEPTTDDSIPELTPPTFETATSEDEAIEQAVEAINAYYVAASYLYNAHGEHAERIEDFADGSALEFQRETIQRAADIGRTVEGAPVIGDVQLGTATLSEASGSELEFGYADITACVDLSGYRLFQADGTEQGWEHDAGITQFAANFYPETSSWLVEMEEVTGEPC